MVTSEDEDEAKKPHGKVRMESLKMIVTSYASPKRKRSNEIDVETYEETPAHISTMKKVTINTRASVKPQKEWNFNYTVEPPLPIRPLTRTKYRISMLEKHQREEIIHRDTVRRRLLDLENKKEINEMMGKVADAMNAMRSEFRKAMHHISILEETNRKLRGAVSSNIPSP